MHAELLAGTVTSLVLATLLAAAALVPVWRKIPREWRPPVLALMLSLLLMLWGNGLAGPLGTCVVGTATTVVATEGAVVINGTVSRVPVNATVTLEVVEKLPTADLLGTIAIVSVCVGVAAGLMFAYEVARRIPGLR